MKTISHQEQQERWEKEHRQPVILPQMDVQSASGGVVKFLEWYKQHAKHDDFQDLCGLEMCCGKGRNVIWLAQQGFQMIGADFSTAAIAEAKKRATTAGV